MYYDGNANNSREAAEEKDHRYHFDTYGEFRAQQYREDVCAIVKDVNKYGVLRMFN